MNSPKLIIFDQYFCNLIKRFPFNNKPIFNGRRNKSTIQFQSLQREINIEKTEKKNNFSNSLIHSSEINENIYPNSIFYLDNSKSFDTQNHKNSVEPQISNDEIIKDLMNFYLENESFQDKKLLEIQKQYQISYNVWKKLLKKAKYNLEKKDTEISQLHIEIVRVALEENKFRSPSELYYILEKKTALSRMQIRNLVSYVKRMNHSIKLNRESKILLETLWRKYNNEGIKSKKLYDTLEQITHIPRSQIREEVKYLKRKYQEKQQTQQKIQYQNNTTLNDNINISISENFQHRNPLHNQVITNENDTLNSQNEDFSKNYVNTPTHVNIVNSKQTNGDKYLSNSSNSFNQINSNKFIPQKESQEKMKHSKITAEQRNIVKKLLLQYDNVEKSQTLYDILECETGLKRKQLYFMVHEFRKLDL